MSRRLGRTFAWLLLTPVLGWLLILVSIIVFAERNAGNAADVIVVLGAAQYDGRPSPVLKARLDHAVTLYKAGRAPRLLLTGGRRDGDAVSEAVAGQRYSVKQGIPGTAIMVEGVSRTTLESIQSAARMLEGRRGTLLQFTGSAVGADNQTDANSATRERPIRVLLVSDPFHMLRLTVLARMYGLDPVSSPTRTSPISASRSVAMEYVLRESMALPADVAAVAWERVVGP